MSPRTIVITGASGGLAQEIIGQLPKEDKIILIGRSKEKLEKRYAKASHISAIGMDIKDSKAIESVLQTLFQNMVALMYLSIMLVLDFLKIITILPVTKLKKCLRLIPWPAFIFLDLWRNIWQNKDMGIFLILFLWQD